MKPKIEFLLTYLVTWLYKVYHSQSDFITGRLQLLFLLQFFGIPLLRLLLCLFCFGFLRFDRMLEVVDNITKK